MPRRNSNETFDEMLARLKADKAEPRAVETIEERQYYLIVCEGLRTEPNYFDYLKQFLPKHLLETIQIMGQGENTVNVVKKAIHERDRRKEDKINPPFDEVWAVFDKDDFPSRRFNEAVRLAETNGIRSGHSNQAFELWYVLHFQYLDTAISRDDYFQKLTSLLKRQYIKNDKSIVAQLFEKGNVKRAIKWAHRLEEMHLGATPSQACPSTRIHILVKSLLKYSKHPSLREQAED